MFLAILFYVGLFAFLAVAFFRATKTKRSAAPAQPMSQTQPKSYSKSVPGLVTSGGLVGLAVVVGLAWGGGGRYGRGNDLFPPEILEQNVVERRRRLMSRFAAHDRTMAAVVTPQATADTTSAVSVSLSLRRTLCEPNGRASLRPSQVTDCAIAEKSGPAAHGLQNAQVKRTNLKPAANQCRIRREILPFRIENIACPSASGDDACRLPAFLRTLGTHEISFGVMLPRVEVCPSKRSRYCGARFSVRSSWAFIRPAPPRGKPSSDGLGFSGRPRPIRLRNRSSSPTSRLISFAGSSATLTPPMA